MWSYWPIGGIAMSEFAVGREQAGDTTPGVISRHLLAQAANRPGRRVDRVTQCGACGETLDKKEFALRCRSCGTALVQDSDLTERARPDGLLPFEIDENTARAAFATWVSSRHLAPRTLKGTRQPASVEGAFLPFWTFSAGAVTEYVGERGKTRHRAVTNTRTNANGQTETYTVSEAYTEWRPVSGQVSTAYSGILLPACSPLAEKIPPWPLERSTPYVRGGTSDKRVVAYDIEPEHGFDQATALMSGWIEQAVRDDIGGNKQRVRDSTTTYIDPAYTLLLLPAWLVSYVHAGQTWSVLVNGSSGEVVGDRPYSGAKISVLVGVLAVVVAAAIAAILLARQ
jgi:hypothetical protein